MAVRIYPQILLAYDIGHAATDGDAQEIAQFDVDAVVGLVWFFDVFKGKGEGDGVLEFAGRGEFGLEGEEFVVGAAVEEHFNGADELHFDACVFEAFAVFGSDGHGALDGLAVEVERAFLAAGLVEFDVDGGAVVGAVEDDVDVERSGEGEDGHVREGAVVVVVVEEEEEVEEVVVVVVVVLLFIACE